MGRSLQVSDHFEVTIQDDDDDLEPFHMLENATRDSSHHNKIITWLVGVMMQHATIY